MRAVFCFVVLFWAFSIDVAVGTPPISAFRHHKTGYSSDRKHLAPSGRCNTLLKMEAAEDSCSSPRKPTAPKIIIAGAPAAGKGTQCELIKRELGVVHLSTGDMLRAAVKDQTELGMKVKTYMEEGKLVPDDLIINVVVERLQMPDCQSKGWLLDGFPRTRAQADALTRLGIEVDQFVLLDVPQEVVVERVTGRRTDPDTGRIYHMTFSPPDPVADAEVIARLVQRSDDTEDKVRRRFADYCKHVDSVKACYGDRTLWVDGSISPSEVSEVILSALGEVVTAADKVVEGASLGTAAAGGSGVGEGLRGSTPGGGGGGDVGAFSVGSSTALRLLRAAHSEDNVRKRARKASTASTAHGDNAGAKEIGSHAFGLRNFGPRASAQTARFAK